MFILIPLICLSVICILCRFREKKQPVDVKGRINKHGDVYQIIGNETVLLKFYDIKNDKWIYALDICDLDSLELKGVRPRRFKRVEALNMAHKIDVGMFINLHNTAVRSYVKRINKKANI